MMQGFMRKSFFCPVMFKIFILCLVLLSSRVAMAQLFVYDASTLIEIENAQLVGENYVIYERSNSLGELQIKIGRPNLPDTFTIFALGYRPLVLSRIALDTLQEVFLDPLDYHLREVEISDYATYPIRTEPGIIRLDAGKLSKLPTVFAEPDLLKSLQLLPGVSSVMENNVGLYVRGGSATQSLISLDGATMYNPSHSLGFFSVVHPASVSSASLIKEGIPGDYGSRASAFLDVHLKEGNFNSFKATASMGLISSYIDLQGPISTGENAMSFQFVGRTTYIDRIINLLSSNESSFNTGFNDVSLKFASKLKSGKKMTLAFYRSKDKFKVLNGQLVNLASVTEWDNNIISLRVADNSSENWLKSSRFSFSSYQLDNQFTGAVHNSGVDDFSLEHIWLSKGSTNLIQKIGFLATYHRVLPGRMTVLDSAFYNLASFEVNRQHFLEISPFINFHRNLSQSIELSAHLRLSSYTSHKMRLYPEPRIQLKKHTAIGVLSLSFDRLSQYMHLYSSSITPMPTDVWFSSSAKVPPVVSSSFSLSYNTPEFNKDYSISSSVYFRHFENISDINSGSAMILEPGYERFLKVGTNQSYGWELLIRKQKGSLTGWISYTYSRSINRISGILSEGETYNANHDKPHMFNAVASRRIGNWELNGVFVFESGRPITIPIYSVGIINEYSERNEYRLPYYHRMDLSLIYHQKKRKHRQGSWMISVYNMYNRQNVYNVQYNPISGSIDYLTLFPILPMASYKAELF